MGNGNLNLNGDTHKLMLTNTVPVATNRQYSDISSNELANGNGYTTGGSTISGTSYAQSSGTATFHGSSVVYTASGGTMGPFRYVVAYDSTPVVKTLEGWWDYGSSITLNSGETFTATIDGTNGILQVT
jgi:hypothetical protein